MLKPTLALLLLASSLFAEIRPMTLRQAVEMAIKQNPDIALARLDEEKARQGVRVARDPFTPRLTVGSGLAYSNGFPMSIEGSAPSVIQARASEFIFNRPQSFAVAQAKEDARGAAIAVGGKRDEVAYRVTSLVPRCRAGCSHRRPRAQGRRQPGAGARHRPGAGAGRARAAARGKDGGVSGRVLRAKSRRISRTTRRPPRHRSPSRSDFPRRIGCARSSPSARARRCRGREEQAIDTAVESNKELRRIESQIASKQLEMRGQRAARWPRVDLVAQYAMLARFNNYEEFFQKFPAATTERSAPRFSCRCSPGPASARRPRRRKPTCRI